MALGSTVALGGAAAVATGGSILANVGAHAGVHLGGSDRIRIGLIGCGARGKAAVIEAITAGRNGLSDCNDFSGVHLVAMADTSSSQLQTAYRTVKGRHRDSVDVGSRRFVGPDGWRGVLASDVDLVILATPPASRAGHFEEAVRAGKHVFMECPIAINSHDVQRIADAGRLAQTSGLAVAVGHQRRHELRTRECVAKLRDGVIGDLIYARTYSSDSQEDRHVQSLDIVNWVLGHGPVAAQGFGNASGDVSAYQLIEFTYPNNFPMISQCRQTRGGRNLGEFFHGTHGTCDMSRAAIHNSDGKLIWQSEAKEIPGKGWQRQFNELIASLRAGEAPFELEHAIASTAAAILGRTAVQSGELIRQA
ncbi:putative oxidoreductase [Allorhodopirellula heiligendammensis]|uniref:Oxidoreductase n=2 Tax=Allorhodopirellula heiligendammensis TaxID=2714739 RepID=A0A5C6BXI4_9BACT|nr:putative oxidoreductase [Allorhodopirellula heiligendammensis]